MENARAKSRHPRKRCAGLGTMPHEERPRALLDALIRSATGVLLLAVVAIAAIAAAAYAWHLHVLTTIRR